MKQEEIGPNAPHEKQHEPKKGQMESANADTAKPAGPTQVRAQRLEMLKQVEELKRAKLQKQIDKLATEIDGEDDDTQPTSSSGEANPPTAVEKKFSGPSRPATLRGRHVFTLISFLMFVILPTLFVGWYMMERAADRYVSYMGFSVRTEETGSAFELLGGVAELSGSSSSDTDILYRFIESQQLVAAVDARIDLEKIWNHPDVENDPIFAYEQGGTIEDITDYWNQMVSVFADNSTGLIDLRVQAFTPEDAQLVAETIFDESLQMINRLSAIAREDATGYAREELEQTVERLKVARTAMTQFRNRTQIIDPSASISSQLGILTTLQSELAQTLIDLDLLLQSTTENDPRVLQTTQRVTVIERRIAEEQAKFGQGSDTGLDAESAFADLIGEFEVLAVDVQFAEASYQASQATLDAAINEARRQSRYLAAHIQPTLPQAPEQPHRLTITALFGMFAFLAWSILLLTSYAFRDRR